MRRILFEVSETQKLRDVDHLRHIVDSDREVGLRTALDDFGAGFAGLRLPPARLGLTLVVEGVETAADLRVMEDMGLRRLQGCLLARPQFEALQSMPSHYAAAPPPASRGAEAAVPAPFDPSSTPGRRRRRHRAIGTPTACRPQIGRTRHRSHQA